MGISTDEGDDKLYLYGGHDHLRYLGCLNCDITDEDSIWNKEGEYGSTTGYFSIWNKEGQYGAKHRNYSPWKKISGAPPYILNKKRKFYGVFTADRFSKNRCRIEWIIWILEHEDYVRENFDEMASEIDEANKEASNN